MSFLNCLPPPSPHSDPRKTKRSTRARGARAACYRRSLETNLLPWTVSKSGFFARVRSLSTELTKAEDASAAPPPPPPRWHATVSKSHRKTRRSRTNPAVSARGRQVVARRDASHAGDARQNSHLTGKSTQLLRAACLPRRTCRHVHRCVIPNSQTRGAEVLIQGGV